MWLFLFLYGRVKKYKMTHLVSRAFSKSGFQFFSDGFVFLLLSNKFILQSVNLFLEFLDRSLSKFSSGLGLLQLGSKRLDLFLVAGLSLVGLLFRDLKGFQVAGNNSQFFFKLNDLHFTSFSSFLSSLQFRFHLLKSLLDFLILLISFLSLVSGRLQFFLKLSHSFLILNGSILQNLPHSVRVISSSSSLVKFIGSLKKLVLTLLKIFFKALYSSVKSIDFQLSREKIVLLLLQLLSCETEFFLGLIQLNLKLLRLFDKISNFFLSLGSSDLGILGSLFTGIRPVHGIILLHLHCLHLLLDGIHGC